MIIVWNHLVNLFKIARLLRIFIGINKITDKGNEILLPYLIGNITINKIDITFNKGITDKSVPKLKEIIQKSNIEVIYIIGTSITKKQEKK